MPYTEHESCKTPEDLNQQVWRYMDFTKFVAMLEKKSLFFSNLARLDDPLEGYPTKRTIEQFNNRVSDEPVPGVGDMKRLIRDTQKDARKHTYVSCWHMSNYESAAMWKLYLKNGEGVAIQSTVGKLIESVKHTLVDVYIGEVEYLDYEKDEGPMDTILSLATAHKRKSFEHEKELRAIIVGPRRTSGINVSVNLDVLIEKIYLAPTSQKWIRDLLKKLISRYGLDKQVVKSALNQNPPY